MEFLLDPNAWIAFLTLTLLEVVLGIDNIIFISIITNNLPKENQQRTRLVGLAGAMLMRIAMLFGISWIMTFDKPIMSFSLIEISAKDVILIIGGLFLLAKSTTEIHSKVERKDKEEKQVNKKSLSFISAIIQIILLDLVFSFDSILTAIGLSKQIEIMVAAVIVAILVMMIFAGAIGRFINKHPTLQVLALSFLLLIAFMLILDGIHYEVPKEYIYFAVAFSLFVELINMRVRKNFYTKKD